MQVRLYADHEEDVASVTVRISRFTALWGHLADARKWV